MYDNCRILAPDNTLLSTCSRKKLQWYLDKNLGELIEDNTAATASTDPNGDGTDDGIDWSTSATVRLFFEPSGRASEKDGYENR